jgi:aryl-alcohol dehydrogenase
MKISAMLEDDSGTFVPSILELEDPRQDEVLVRIKACGICHTDMVMRGGDYLLGHEASGIIEKTGGRVRGFKPGDRVVLSYAYCGTCRACKEGRAYECRLFSTFWDGRREDGTTPLSIPGTKRAVYPLLFQGGFSSHAVCHPNGLTRVDTPLGLEFLGPLGCGVITGAGSVLNYLKPERGKPLAVFGSGTVGLSAIMAAKVAGCDPIIAVDRIPLKMDLAREFGATHCLNGDTIADLATAVTDICGGIDYGFDTSGDHRLLEVFRRVLNENGKACGVGIGGSIHFSPAERKQGKTWESPTDGWSVPQKFIPYLLSLHADGAFPFDRMITFYPFERINEAFADAESGKAVKPVLVMNVKG